MRSRTLARRPIAVALRGRGIEIAPRQIEELVDTRYRETFDISSDLRRRFGWAAKASMLPRYSYVERADRIYQAYAASCVARALGLTQTAPVLGAEPLAFAGQDFDLYYDTLAPPNVLKSWRAASARPDASRPDVLLHERSTGRVAIIDAKYRLSGEGGASEDSRKDVTSYLGLYGLRSVAILYPGAAEVSVVEGHGQRIVEIPVSPPASNLSDIRGGVLAALDMPRYL